MKSPPKKESFTVVEWFFVAFAVAAFLGGFAWYALRSLHPRVIDPSETEADVTVAGAHPSAVHFTPWTRLGNVISADMTLVQPIDEATYVVYGSGGTILAKGQVKHPPMQVGQTALVTIPLDDEGKSHTVLIEIR